MVRALFQLWAGVWVATCLAPGCAQDDAPPIPLCEATKGEPRQLTDNAAWSAMDGADDPFWDPAKTPCEEERYGPEETGDGLWFDMETKGCDGVTVRQAAATCAAEGEELNVWIWHFAMDPAQGDYHALVAVGEPPTVIWEKTAAMPAEAGIIFEQVVLHEAVEEGTPVTFHLSNHGENVWSLIGLSVGPVGSHAP